MLAFEGDPEYAKRSDAGTAARAELLAGAPAGSITMDDAPRVPVGPRERARFPVPPRGAGPRGGHRFWCVADVTTATITFGRGNPCDSVAQEYTFPS